MQNIPEIENLVKLISKLPGLGPKSARRIILKLINNRNELMKPMLNSLSNVLKNISRCGSCGALKSNSSKCNNCEIVNKKFNKICIVENIADQWSIENSNIYYGYFHILGGTISNTNSERKEDLLVDSLMNRIKRDNIEEVIIATNPSTSGNATAMYLQKILKDHKVVVSRLAIGLPVGSNLEYIDDKTVATAIKERVELN